MCKSKRITCEYVSYGHPDKIADQISDALLDAYLRKDPNARTGIETMVKDNIVVLGGEINSTAKIDYDSIVRQTYSLIPFPENHNLSPDKLKIINLIGKQSPEIHAGVDQSETVIGAGDQGFVVGFASNETKVSLPLGHYLAKKICNAVCEIEGLGPDAKSQVVVDYVYDNENDTYFPPQVKSILVSTMHTRPLGIVRSLVIDKVQSILFEEHIHTTEDFDIDINPCGSWQMGGPVSDCGVTGRKIVVDQYGGYANVGGGAFSGKDGTKVDRSAAYMARYLALNIVRSGFCNNAKVELAYMIGVPDPVALNIEVDDNFCKVAELKQWIMENVDMTPYGIMKRFDLTKPIYGYLARNGHFGNTTFPWEQTDLTQEIYKIFN